MEVGIRTSQGLYWIVLFASCLCSRSLALRLGGKNRSLILVIVVVGLFFVFFGLSGL